MSHHRLPDVVIAGEDGVIYRLTQDQLKQHVMPGGKDRERVEEVVNVGCKTAAVSKSDPSASWYAVHNLGLWKAPDSND